jgi:hypothetical protein
MKTKHKHAELIALYAQDAMETDKPWERWEYSSHGIEWFGCSCNPSWGTELEYRRKPKTIRIGDYDVPEPVREPLNDWDWYWVACLTNGATYLPWRGDVIEIQWLSQGLIHRTKEAAELHVKALLSFTAATP